MSEAEGSGLCILDVVKHAMKTIINSMNENDRLLNCMLFRFFNNCFTFIFMDVKGQDLALARLELLQPDSMTNLWDGLETGMNPLTPQPNSPRSTK